LSSSGSRRFSRLTWSFFGNRGPHCRADTIQRQLPSNPFSNVTKSGFVVLPDDPDPSMVPGFWVGLAMMGSLFSAEHNAVVDALASAYRHWNQEELFHRARLVITALIAKIHTVEWTPAVINHPTTVLAMRINWYGLAGQRIRDTFGRISKSEVISGILGGKTDHFGVPYSLTEEFSVVYRVHPLMPDLFDLRHWSDDALLDTHTLRELSGPSGKTLLDQLSMADLLYSFGTSNPGAIVLHDFPNCLQEFQRPKGEFTDLAATDILRSRETVVRRASPGTMSSADCCTSSRPGPSPT
jgi:hypothetical protein